MGERIKERLERIEHKGVTIFVGNYRGLAPGPFERHIRENRAAMVEICEQGDYEIRTLTDVSDTIIGGEVLKELRENAKVLKSYIKGNAVVGIVGFRKHLLGMIKLMPGFENMGQFDTVEEAKDWLAQTAKK